MEWLIGTSVIVGSLLFFYAVIALADYWDAILGCVVVVVIFYGLFIKLPPIIGAEVMRSFSPPPHTAKE